MTLTHVSGKNVGNIVLYALSTCPWCRKTKELLNSLGVEYHYTDVDLATGEDRRALMSAVQRWNPGLSFPVLVINDSQAIIGFKENDIRAALKV